MENIQEKVEDKVIDWIVLGSGGRLIAFKPDNGADLAVQRKGDYPGKELFFVLNIFETPSKTKSFKTDVLQSKLLSQKDIYLIFIIFDEIKQKIEEKFWLVPASDFVKISPSLKFDAPLFSKYFTDKKSFNIFLIEKLISDNKQKSKIGFKHKQY
jgi:hypothetical protein